MKGAWCTILLVLILYMVIMSFGRFAHGEELTRDWGGGLFPASCRGKSVEQLREDHPEVQIFRVPRLVMVQEFETAGAVADHDGYFMTGFYRSQTVQWFGMTVGHYDHRIWLAAEMGPLLSRYIEKHEWCHYTELKAGRNVNWHEDLDRLRGFK